MGLLPISSMLLTRLDSNRPILPPTPINLQILLVGSNIHLDARCRTADRQHDQIRRLGSRIPWPIQDERVIVAGTVESTLVRVHNIPSNLLWGGEVKGSTGYGLELASRNENGVDYDGAGSIGHVKGVVEDVCARTFGEGVEVPVDVIGEHEGRGGIEGDGNEAGGPLRGGD